jgi:hypothetical protein
MSCCDPRPTPYGYAQFLYQVVNVPPRNLPAAFNGTGTVVAQSNVLTVLTQTLGVLLPGAYVQDQNGFICYGTTVVQQLSGQAGSVGTYQLSNPATTTSAMTENLTVVNHQVWTTLRIALEIVNTTLCQASSDVYTWAVYNLAADRLVNYAQDVNGQTFFTEKRRDLNLNTVSVGVVAGSSDQGTASSIMNPEQMQRFTLRDLQTLKTPWGREYMGLAQMYGVSLWGLT